MSESDYFDGGNKTGNNIEEPIKGNGANPMLELSSLTYHTKQHSTDLTSKTISEIIESIFC